jgi:tetratricopeptide (TPR) repeat protein
VNPTAIRTIGLCATAIYAAFVAWLFAVQPRTASEVRGGVAATLGAYRIDQASFEEGLRFFHADQFVESRSAFARADPAQRDARTQFYIAYSYYRQGWGRVYSDDALYRQGLEAVERAIAVAPDGRVHVTDPNLKMTTADELKAELERGLTRDADDFNPLRVFRDRK